MTDSERTALICVYCDYGLYSEPFITVIKNPLGNGYSDSMSSHSCFQNKAEFYKLFDILRDCDTLIFGGSVDVAKYLKKLYHNYGFDFDCCVIDITDLSEELFCENPPANDIQLMNRYGLCFDDEYTPDGYDMISDYAQVLCEMLAEYEETVREG